MTDARQAIPVFGGRPQFATRIAHLCYHRVRDHLPFSAPSFPALLAHVRQLAALGFNAVCLDPFGTAPYASAPELAMRLSWTPE